MAEPTRVDVSRRTVLKGIAGAAGLISIPAIIAACSSTGSSGGGCQRRRQRRSGRQLGPRIGVDRELPHRPGRAQGPEGRRRRLHGRDRHRRQDQHRRPQHLPEPDLELPWRAAGLCLHLVLRLPDEVLRQAGPVDADRRPVGQGQGQLRRRLPEFGRRRRRQGLRRSRSTTTRGPSSTARASSRTRSTTSPRHGTTSRPCAPR